MLVIDEAFFLYIKALSPAAIDLELRTLADVPATKPYFVAFLNALSARLRTHRDFEAVQSFLAVFLRLHGATIIQEDGDDTSVQVALEDLVEVQKIESERVLELVSSSLGTLSFVRDTT